MGIIAMSKKPITTIRLMGCDISLDLVRLFCIYFVTLFVYVGSIVSEYKSDTLKNVNISFSWASDQANGDVTALF